MSVSVLSFLINSSTAVGFEDTVILCKPNKYKSANVIGSPLIYI